MLWITLRIARIRHPVKGKPDDLTCASDCLELGPILSRCRQFSVSSTFAFREWLPRTTGLSCGLGTTPAVVPNPAGVKVTATATADPTKSGSATVSGATPTGLGTSRLRRRLRLRAGRRMGI